MGRIVIVLLLMGFIISALSLVIAAEGTVETRWDNNGGDGVNPYCFHDNSGGASWAYPESGFSPVMNDCYKEVVASGRNDCCPSGYVCDINTDKCISSLVGDCGDYKTPADCNNDEARVAVVSVNIKTGNRGYCMGFTIDEWDFGAVHCINSTGNCACLWKNGKCTANYNITKFCTDGAEEPVGTCSFSISELTNCSAGFRKMIWTATWSPGTKPVDASCDDGEKTVPCPAQLNFSSIEGIIIAVVLIIILYLVMRKKRAKPSEVKRKKKR